MDLDSWYVISIPTIMKVRVISKFSDKPWRIDNSTFPKKLKIGDKQELFIIFGQFESVTNNKCIYMNYFEYGC